MDNEKGKLVLAVLKTFNGSATVKDIATHAAIALGSKLEDVQDWVKATLEGGIECGYIRKSGLHYVMSEEQMDSDDCGSETLSDGAFSGEDDDEAEPLGASSDSDASAVDHVL